MPGSVAETRYGRRGGGWLPRDTSRAQAEPAPPKDPVCSICGAKYSDHSGDTCPACLQAVEHCTDPAACWEGKARMAHARRDAGRPLTAVDQLALRRHPTRPPLIEET